MHVLITGAEQGLGLRIKELLEGADHTVTNMPGDIVRRGDPAISRFVEEMVSAPEIIINNFGINRLSWIGETPTADGAIIEVNLLGPYWVVNAVRAEWGGPCRVVNIASQTHRIAQRCTTLYCAAKAGLVHMTRVMARELANEGWIINCVSPGKIEDTEMSRLTDAQVIELREWDKETAEEYALVNIPMERFSNTNEIARVVIQTLALPDYVNGSVIEAHGGA
jgi:NAD(P)-dependent dehydrogenase (short-subunit alcohol dehydrogenase family)